MRKMDSFDRDKFSMAHRMNVLDRTTSINLQNNLYILHKLVA